MAQYNYTKSPVSLDRLTQEIQQSSITVALDSITLSGSDLTILFKASLSNAEETTLTGLVTAHDGTPLPQNTTTNVKVVENVADSKDVDGRTLTRPVAAKSGWTYFLCPIEFTTAKLSSVVSKNQDNTDRSGVTYKIYDSNNTEITDAQNELNAVKTVIDFEPNYDYEIIGGHLQQHTKPSTNIRIWVVGVPDVAVAYGGSKEMVGGVNLKFIDPTDKVNADGRVSKYMTYNATYHTNKMRLILRHDAGVQHDVMMILEMFKN